MKGNTPQIELCGCEFDPFRVGECFGDSCSPGYALLHPGLPLFKPFGLSTHKLRLKVAGGRGMLKLRGLRSLDCARDDKGRGMLKLLGVDSS